MTVWSVLLAARRMARRHARDFGEYGLDALGRAVPAESASAWVTGGFGRPFTPGTAAPPAARALLELYLPVCAATAEAPVTVGHLGQSLDGHIATASGDSYYVTGPDNLVHLHRMRALCDAVIVGAGTVATDDPRLTVRHTEGASPVRVVLDPRRRLSASSRVFADGAAETLLVCGDDTAGATPGNAETLSVPTIGDRLDLAALVSALHSRGLHALFVEGGGSTVSAFLEAGLLDRLQIAIAPLVTGAGTPGLRLPARTAIAECLRPSHRLFAMGGDVLFDCDLRTPAAPASSGDLRRIY